MQRESKRPIKNAGSFRKGEQVIVNPNLIVFMDWLRAERLKRESEDAATHREEVERAEKKEAQGEAR